MVYKDLEGTKQARKELAEKESKLLLALQGGKAAKPKSKPIVIDMIATSYEDYKQFKSLFTTDTEMDSDDDNTPSSLVAPKLAIQKTIDNVNELKVLLETHQWATHGEGSSHSANGVFGTSYMNVLFDEEKKADTSDLFPPYPNMNMSNGSPTYFVYKKKMEKLQRRSLLKELIKKYASESFDLSLVDTTLSDEQVEDMLATCLKLELEPEGDHDEDCTLSDYVEY